ncbi:hypothetical protein N7448_011226 [Penicillium atrosanguineum]|nr:hypothetical protein N7448_011226 [Penicillium atrosanguineum]
MLTQEVENISEPGFGFENSLGDTFQEPDYTENGCDVGGLAPDVLAQTSQLHEPDNIEYLAPSIQPPPVGLEATIYQCLRKDLRPDAFKAALIPPDVEQVRENNGLP